MEISTKIVSILRFDSKHGAENRFFFYSTPSTYGSKRPSRADVKTKFFSNIVRRFLLFFIIIICAGPLEQILCTVFCAMRRPRTTADFDRMSGEGFRGHDYVRRRIRLTKEYCMSKQVRRQWKFVSAGRTGNRQNKSGKNRSALYCIHRRPGTRFFHFYLYNLQFCYLTSTISK